MFAPDLHALVHVQSSPLGLLAALAVAAALGAVALKDDPRFAGVDWALARERLLFYVEGRAGWLDPDDIVQAVLTKAFRTDIRPWNRESETLTHYLGSLANTEMSNRRSSAYERKERGELEGVVEKVTVSPEADAESVFARANDERRHEKLLGQLRASVSSNKAALFLLDHYENGGDKGESNDAAFAAGYTMKDLTAARQKFHRDMGKLLAAEEEEAAQALRVAARGRAP